MSRRSYLTGSAALLVTLGAGRLFGESGPLMGQPQLSSYPFKLGVASGDPTADGFVLWTRLAPDPLNGGGMPTNPVKVRWQVSEDEAMTKIVARGEETASPHLAHSVHVEVSGMKPDRWYWYEFKVGNDVSPRGRTRTLEHPDRPAAETSPLKMSFASCQHFEMGYYTAYEHMLNEAPDIVLHLGDYIYEGKARKKLTREHNGPEIKTLEDYRNRHAQYKTDTALQAMHAAAPWVVTWDDHEFDNNYAGDIPEEKGPAERADFLNRRAAAYQAYYEHMPLRASSIPNGPGMKLYRTVRHGKLIDFHVLDTRQYRSDQPLGDGRRAPSPELLDPAITMLGNTQKKWLLDELVQSRPTWNVLAQQVMMARVDRVPGDEEGYSMDQWPGYEMERRELLSTFGKLRNSNPIVLTGDIHSHWANNLVAIPDNPEAPVVGTEFVCTSISSNGDRDFEPALLEELRSENPFVNYFSTQRGHVTCEINAKQWKTDFQVVDYVSRPGAPLKTHASFVVENGKAGMETA